MGCILYQKNNFTIISYIFFNATQCIDQPDHLIRNIIFTQKQSKFQVKISNTLAARGTVGLAEGITNDKSLVYEYV